MRQLFRSSACIAIIGLAISVLAIDKDILDSYSKVQAAVLKKDATAMKQLWLTYVDPSCTSERKGKKLSYKQMTDQVEPQMKMVKKVNSCKIQVVSSKSKAGKTICTVLTTQSFVIAVGGKDSVFDQVTTVEDTWKKINGRYKIVEIKPIKESIKQDGISISNN
jgi:hypothetical protein